MNEEQDKESVKVLRECIELQIKKSKDYQNPNSRVRQADYYPNGIETIHDIMHAKMLRMKSIMETMKDDSNAKVNFESLEDSAKDLINYASFFIAWTRYGVDGQDIAKDLFNRSYKKMENESDDVYTEISFDIKKVSDTVKAKEFFLDTGIVHDE